MVGPEVAVLGGGQRFEAPAGAAVVDDVLLRLSDRREVVDRVSLVGLEDGVAEVGADPLRRDRPAATPFASMEPDLCEVQDRPEDPDQLPSVVCCPSWPAGLAALGLTLTA